MERRSFGALGRDAQAHCGRASTSACQANPAGQWTWARDINGLFMPEPALMVRPVVQPGATGFCVVWWCGQQYSYECGEYSRIDYHWDDAAEQLSEVRIDDGRYAPQHVV